MPGVPFTCAINFAGEVTVASDASGTTDIGDVNANRVLITGTNAIASFGAVANQFRIVRFQSALQLQDGASLGLLGGATRTVSAGAVGIYVSDDSGGWVELSYFGQHSPQDLPIGTAMLFVQAAAPTGWTKSTAINDMALRVVSGSTGGTTGGAIPFSSLFVASGFVTGDTVGPSPPLQDSSSVVSGQLDQAPNTPAGVAIIGYAAGAAAHHHTVPSLALEYVDVIVCTKN